MDNFDFAKNQQEAEERSEKFRRLDPFQAIPSALLNSGDIEDYIRLTSLIHPYNPEKMKSASYEANLLGPIFYWENGKKHEMELRDGSTFRFPKNSIAYASIDTTFRLPYYIALRFNLRINHVHRGILLGTGPLVDPGFHGKILIPLHNLTNNEYILTGGEGLIWIEFTKVSPNDYWETAKTKQYERTGDFEHIETVKRIENHKK